MAEMLNPPHCPPHASWRVFMQQDPSRYWGRVAPKQPRPPHRACLRLSREEPGQRRLRGSPGGQEPVAPHRCSLSPGAIISAKRSSCVQLGFGRKAAAMILMHANVWGTFDSFFPRGWERPLVPPTASSRVLRCGCTQDAETKTKVTPQRPSASVCTCVRFCAFVKSLLGALDPSQVPESPE